MCYCVSNNFHMMKILLMAVYFVNVHLFFKLRIIICNVFAY